MKELTLHHSAFRDYPHKDRRFLFEGDGISLFVWITPKHKVSSFQIENNCNYFIRYWLDNSEHSVFLRKDGKYPSDPEIQALKNEISLITNNDFVEMFASITKVVSGAKNVQYYLSDTEFESLKQIGIWDYSDDNIDNNKNSIHEKTVDINKRLKTKKNPIKW